MLVLSRHRNERIFIGDSIVIEVTDIDRGKIRLGITCPREIPIVREEVAPADHPLRRKPAPVEG